MNNIFFWDTIQFGSKHAHWYFEQNFSHLLLPDDIDSGHPPGFGMYIALIWMIFGKTLYISHLAMLPFIYLSIFWAYKIGSELTDERFGSMFSIILLANTIYLGHSILVSPDIILVACFLGILYAVLIGNNTLKSILVILLACISLRGMMLAFAFYIYELYELRTHRKLNFNNALHSIIAYIPGGLLGLTYLLIHYYSKGWLVYHDASPWAGSYEIVDLKGVIKNFFILGWRLIDFGFIFLWLGLGMMSFKNIFRVSQKTRKIIALWILLFILTAVPLIFYQYLTGHRYLLPIYILLSFIFLLFLNASSLKKKQKNWVLIIVLVGMFSGNFWVYPDTISQGWDVTLAHTPYYKLREHVITFIKENGIEEEDIGTKFPAKTINKLLYLTEDPSGFKNADFEVDNYILYSNIFNDFTDEERQKLYRNWNLIYMEEIRFVHFYLYERK